MTALLELADIRKSFGGVRAVDGVSLSVQAGRFFALLGPSGCGKTTLLRMIAGFEKPDSGALRLDGSDLVPVSPNRRPVNLMFQSYALFPHMRVRENIAYGLEAEGVAAPEVKRRTGEAMEMVKLSELAERKPAELSGGQRQRVALARALVKRPRLLLLDEPLGALDKKLRASMQIELKALQRDTGITFMVVTHDQEEALSMADEVCLLDRGKVVESGAPRDLYESPKTLFTAEFLGGMNMLPGRWSGAGFVDESGLRLAWGSAPGLAEGAACMLVVRPERLQIHADNAPGRLAATVAGMAYFGSEAEVKLARREGGWLTARVSAAALDRMQLDNGKAVFVDWPGEKARILS